MLVGGLALPAPKASAACAAADLWPHNGHIQNIRGPGANDYSATFEFTLSTAELCRLQQQSKYLEIDFALSGFVAPAGWEDYKMSSDMPGAIHDVAFGDPANAPTPAPTRIRTADLKAGRLYYTNIKWSLPLQAGQQPQIKFRWVPSHYAGDDSTVGAQQIVVETNGCAYGLNTNLFASNADGWCIFPDGNGSKTVVLFGSGGFNLGGVPFANTSPLIPLSKSFSYSWKGGDTQKPTLSVDSVATPHINADPKADFSWSRLNGAGNRISLDGGSSSDPDGSISNWQWKKNGTAFANGRTATVSLGDSTSANITLVVTDNNGSTATITKSITAYNRTPVVTGSSPANNTVVGSNTPTLSATSKDDDGDPIQYNFRVTGPSVDVSSGWVGNSWQVPAGKLDPGTAYNWSVTIRDPKNAQASRSSNFTVAMLPTANELVSLSTGNGYWEVAGDGGVFSYGAAQFYGSLPGLNIRVNNIIGMARTPSDKGYWLVGKDGGVFAFGDAGFYGSLPNLNVNVGNIVGMAPTKDGRGYWLVGSDGGVFAFGNAGFYGSMGGKPINKPIQAIAPTATSQGYWLAGEDGGVYAFGDAPFYGSMGGQQLNYPVVDIDTTPDGKGYWLVAQDGGIFTYGNAGFYGSMAGKPLNGHINSMSVTPDGKGYWLNGCDGGIFAFGNAPFYGSQPRYGCRGISY